MKWETKCKEREERWGVNEREGVKEQAKTEWEQLWMRRSEGKMKCYRKIKRVKGGQGRKKSSGKE